MNRTSKEQDRRYFPNRMFLVLWTQRRADGGIDLWEVGLLAHSCREARLRRLEGRGIMCHRKETWEPGDPTAPPFDEEFPLNNIIAKLMPEDHSTHDTIYHTLTKE